MKGDEAEYRLTVILYKLLHKVLTGLYKKRSHLCIMFWFKLIRISVACSERRRSGVPSNGYTIQTFKLVLTGLY